MARRRTIADTERRAVWGHNCQANCTLTLAVGDVGEIRSANRPQGDIVIINQLCAGDVLRIAPRRNAEFSRHCAVLCTHGRRNRLLQLENNVTRMHLQQSREKTRLLLLGAADCGAGAAAGQGRMRVQASAFQRKWQSWCLATRGVFKQTYTVSVACMAGSPVATTKRTCHLLSDACHGASSRLRHPQP